MQQDRGCWQLIIHWRGGQHLGRCRKIIQVRLRRPTIVQLERSDRRVVPKLSTHDTDHSLAALIASDQVQRQPALNVGCPVVDVMVPSQGTNATGLRVLPDDNSLGGWIPPWEVQENNAGKVGASNYCAFGTIRSRDCAKIE